MNMLAVAVLTAAAAAPPPEWQEAINKVDMLYSNVTFTKYMPEVGNGYVATVIGENVTYMAGVFNGYTPPALPKSNRAPIPSPVALQVPNVTSAEGGLNIKEAVFYNRMTLSDGSTLEHRTYAHRVKRSLLVVEMKWWAEKGGNKTVVSSLPTPGPTSAFLTPNLTMHVAANGDKVTVWDGWTNMAEDNQTFIHVAVVFPANGEYAVEFTNGSTAYLFGVFRSTLDADDPINAALADYNAAAAEAPTLMQSHIDAWATLWESGIEIDRLDVAQNLNASLYYLLSSVREEWKFSLSPCGLAGNDAYWGHTFWDCETWMYPSILVLHVDIAKSLLQYRVDRLPAAKKNALKYNMGWTGAKYPWQTAFTGSEVTAPVFFAEYEIHIGGDISFAAQQFYDLTGDSDWVREGGGYEMVSAIADWFVSRSTWDSEGKAHLDKVTCPDEYHQGNDSVYTNYIVKMNMALAGRFAALADVWPNPKWGQTGDALVIPFNETSRIHPEFAGYTGDKVKQADAILLGFPLMMDMPVDVRRNDLDYYANRTDPLGPDMTWAMFAVGYLETGDLDKAEANFERGFNPNSRQPYMVWTETSDGHGCINFHTGQGGFLQSVLFGYAGLRITSAGLKFAPQLPSGSTTLRIRSFNYMSCKLTLTYTAKTFTLELLSSVTNLIVIDSSTVRHALTGNLTLPTAPFTLTVA